VTSGNLALEHNVNLAVRSTLHLRKEEVCSNETEESSAAPDVTALATDCDEMLAVALRHFDCGRELTYDYRP
jgi:hypothetical protein